ncbi:MAG: helix-turn-helix transcriptional regulator [Spirochaetales bacterium]|jgi:AraC family transcriptional regulator|nr:helix-turn-helix transcriptional regulator [Spirochaetales bacterium]
MDEIELLNEILAYIDAHLHEEVSLKRISDAVCYSDEFVSRFFKRSAGINLFDYIRKKRLILAAAELQKNNGTILDLAMSLGFGSHEVFTRTFSSHLGLSPSEFREMKPGKSLFMPLFKRVESIKEFTMESITIFTQVIDRPERKFCYVPAVKATYYYEYCDELGCDVWGRLLEIKQSLYGPIGAWFPENLRPVGCSRYVQGVEMPRDYTCDNTHGLAEMTLEPVKYLVFQSSPYECDKEDKAMRQAIGAVNDAVKKYNPKLYGIDWAEDAAPHFELAPTPETGYIMGYPVRTIEK